MCPKLNERVEDVKNPLIEDEEKQERIKKIKMWKQIEYYIYSRATILKQLLKLLKLFFRVRTSCTPFIVPTGFQQVTVSENRWFSLCAGYKNLFM